MNWYKLAQKTDTPIIFPILIPLCWIDPQGYIYSVKKSHIEWVCEFKEFIENKYSLILHGCEDEVSRYLNKELLVENGWIRATYDLDWYFDIKSLYDVKSLTVLESKLFEILGIEDNEFFNIFGYKENKESTFYWQEYLDSGETFVEFVKRNRE